MADKASSTLEMPYLQAIQSVPGNTASEKQKWIGKLACCNDEVIGELDKLPPKLQPLLEVETAVRYYRYDYITSALMSDNWTIVNRALKAKWFFDGNHMIVDIEYFKTCIFPCITMRTRIRLVKTLARRIKSSAFAQRMFEALEYAYDYKTALPLIVCCDSDFAYDTVVGRKFMLPLGIFKKIFRKDVDLAVRFLKSFILNCFEYAPIDKNIVQNNLCDVIERYSYFLSLLPKSRPMDFVNIAETIALCPVINIILSKKCSKKFLSKAEEQVAKYPHLYMPILPTKAISSRQMKMMFPALMKYYCHDSFNTDLMLNYLKDYPKDKKFALLCKTFKNVYHKELLDDIERVTPELLKLLPLCDRINQVNIKLGNSISPFDNISNSQFFSNMTSYSHNVSYEINWICYLSVQKAVPIFKYQLDHTDCEKEKVKYLILIIYACLVNEDDDELCMILSYVCVENNWAITSSALWKKIIDHFLLIFNMRSDYLGIEIIFLMFDIIQSVYIKHKYINELVLEKMVHVSIIREMSIKILISMLVKSHQQVSNIQFNILKDYPLYERQCLVTFIDVCQWCFDAVEYEEQYEVEDKKNKNCTKRKMKKEKSKKDQRRKNSAVCRLIVAMYDFNRRCKKSHVQVELMTIKNYRWLLDIIYMITRSKKNCLFRKKALDTLRKQEPELYYDSFFPIILTEIVDVKSGMALRLLKRNSQSIQDNWEVYFAYCKRNCNNKQVQNFVRAIRWYRDIPIKFVKQCMDHLHRKIGDEKSILILLSILLHGNTVQKLIASTTEKDLSNWKKNCNLFTNYLMICMKFFNPPLSLKFFIKNEVLNESYLSTMLMILRSVSRRSSLSEVILFSKNVQNTNIDIRKQWIDLMYVIVPTNYLVTFLEEMWLVERHHSIRLLLLNTVQRLLCERPREETWTLCCRIFVSLSIEEEQLFWKMKYRKNIPDTYCETYFNLWLNTINSFSVAGMRIKRTKEHTEKCLRYLHRYIYVSLSEQYMENLFQRFFFFSDTGMAEATRNFAITYLLQLNNDEFAKYSKLFFQIFFTTILISWNISYHTNPHFYPIRSAVHLYLKQFIIAYMKKRKDQYFDGQVLEDILLLFSTVLSPEQDINSYLLLVYAKKLHAFSYITPIIDNNFGLQLGQIIPDLVHKLSHYMVNFMAELLDYFLKNIYSDSCRDVIFNTINGLMDAKNTYSSFMAMTMLSLQERCTEYNRLIDKAVDIYSQDSSYLTILYDALNKANFDDVPLESDELDIFEDVN